MRHLGNGCPWKKVSLRNTLESPLLGREGAHKEKIKEKIKGEGYLENSFLYIYLSPHQKVERILRLYSCFTPSPFQPEFPAYRDFYSVGTCGCRSPERLQLSDVLRRPTLT